MIKLALLGKDISHSLSPDLYKEIYKNQTIDYQLIDIKHINFLPSLKVLMNDLDGLSITSPYKEVYLSEVIIEDSVISALKAVNCIGKKLDKFYATNTDYTALLELVPEKVENRRIVILGDGVMSRLIESVCRIRGISFEIRSRKLDPIKFNSFSNGEIVDENSLIINCCSRAYSFKGKLGYGSHFWDLNYRHQEHQHYFDTLPTYTDGYSLLKLQAEHAAAFWSQLKN